MKRLFFALCAYLATLTTPLFAAETKVANVAEFDAAVKAAKPGDAIVLRDGEWRDVDLVFSGTGEKPPDGKIPFDDKRIFQGRITLRAETPGKVILAGTSRLKIGGAWLIVEGLLWKNTMARDHVIALRIDSRTPAEDCIVRECAIVGDEATEDGDRKWVSIYGYRNSVERCRFEGKQSAGTLMVVWIPDDAPVSADAVSDRIPKHTIWDNFFGPRTKLGKNGGEIIRIGDSKTSLRQCKTIVGGNYFYRCDGEAEIISNKSCGNGYGHNAFIGCSGALTLRHGNDCRVGSSLFDGDGRPGTGGVRVIGEGHDVSGNLFRNLTGTDVRAALCVMNGIPESPADGYVQVSGLKVSRNRFVECKQNILLGFSDKDRKNQTLAPEYLSFDDNYVISGDSPVFEIRPATATIKFYSDKNRFVGNLGLTPNLASGWTKESRHQLEGEMMVYGVPSAQKILEKTGPAWFRPTEEYLPRNATK